MVARTGIGSQQIRDGKAPWENSQGYEIPISQTLQNSGWCAKKFAWVAKFNFAVSQPSCKIGKSNFKRP